jgi:mannose-6-phosphate isomerase-like protein (cupin superfamily)
MKTERSWGYYEILASAKGFMIKKLVIKPCCAISLQYHKDRYELWYVISGEGSFTLNDKQFVGGPGTIFHVRPNDAHQVRNISFDNDLVAIEIWRGENLDEEDIVRL